ncbi:hypothetical protein PPERSA_04535 [Pseudocohnilembus persalinus]|uniref:Uncharacterized protein n=1 Tax=Pseudocohnilembus persalinus TaxID=266149 RepID=A0A0V0QU36_PSEPJ|nr:hypothetical protein PPERSA_04535 [Pseudocohnilembus persalinus]|eukprot:KRX05498.1 hypothetical protein PPERSA_04535 [Pseudocohnilembus persalinus]
MEKTETRHKILQKMNPIKQQDNYNFYLKLQKKLQENQDKGTHLFNNAYIVKSKVYNHDLIYDPKNDSKNGGKQKNMYQLNQNTYLEPLNNYQQYLHQIQLNKINEKKRILQHQFQQKQKLEQQFQQEFLNQDINIDIQYEKNKNHILNSDQIQLKNINNQQQQLKENSNTSYKISIEKNVGQNVNQNMDQKKQNNNMINNKNQQLKGVNGAFQLAKMHKNNQKSLKNSNNQKQNQFVQKNQNQKQSQSQSYNQYQILEQDQNQNKEILLDYQQHKRTKTEVLNSYRGGSYTQRNYSSNKKNTYLNQTINNNNYSKQFSSVQDLDESDPSFLQSVPLACREIYGENGQLKTEEDLRLYNQGQKNENLQKNQIYQRVRQNLKDQLNSSSSQYMNQNYNFAEKQLTQNGENSNYLTLPQINSRNQQQQKKNDNNNTTIIDHKNGRYSEKFEKFQSLEQSPNFQQYDKSGYNNWQNKSLEYYSSGNYSQLNSNKNSENNKKFVQIQKNRHNIRDMNKKQQDIQEMVVKNYKKSEISAKIDSKQEIQLDKIGQLDINLNSQQSNQKEKEIKMNQKISEQQNNLTQQNQSGLKNFDQEYFDKENNCKKEEEQQQQEQKEQQQQQQQEEEELQQKYIEGKNSFQKYQKAGFQKYLSPNKKQQLEICYEKGFKFSQLQKDLNIFNDKNNQEKKGQEQMNNINNNQSVQNVLKKKSVIFSESNHKIISQQSVQQDKENNDQNDKNIRKQVKNSRQDSEEEYDEEEEYEESDLGIEEEADLFKKKKVKDFFTDDGDKDQIQIRNILFSDQKEKQSKFLE